MTSAIVDTYNPGLKVETLSDKGLADALRYWRRWSHSTAMRDALDEAAKRLAPVAEEATEASANR